MGVRAEAGESPALGQGSLRVAPAPCKGTPEEGQETALGGKQGALGNPPLPHHLVTQGGKKEPKDPTSRQEQ